MKASTILVPIAITAAASSALGLAIGFLPLPLFTAAVGAFFALILAHDYAQPVRRWEPAPIRVAAATEREAATQPLRLAA